jgi:hypothetical protein
MFPKRSNLARKHGVNGGKRPGFARGTRADQPPSQDERFKALSKAIDKLKACGDD